MNSFRNAGKRSLTNYLFFCSYHHSTFTIPTNETVDVMNKIIPTHATHTREVLVLHSKGNVPERKTFLLKKQSPSSAVTMINVERVNFVYWIWVCVIESRVVAYVLRLMICVPLNTIQFGKCLLKFCLHVFTSRICFISHTC